jgi:PKHD-type hydroxylase
MSFWGLGPSLGAKDSVENWSYATDVFSKEECEKIIELGNSLSLEKAVTQGDPLGHSKDVRKSNVSWITPSEQSEWLFRKLTDLVNNANTTFFNFDLWGFGEGLQFTKYEAPDGKYEQHIDKMYSGVVRKLSVVIQLTDPVEYKGGDLNLYTEANPKQVQKGIGSACLFPSYILHQVTPVTEGTRYSLVAWVTGPQFK